MPVTQALADFSIKLLQNVGKEGENSFFSPTSITLALAMCYDGSDANTKSEMNKCLFAGEDDASIHESMHKLIECLNEKENEEFEFELTVANRLYCQKAFDILQSYQDMLKKTYMSEILSVDFVSDGEQVRKDINLWVASSTHDKITDLIPKGTFNGLTRLVLVNALYFKGAWSKTFKEACTSKMAFHVNETKTVDVDMMSQQGRFQYSETDEFQALVLGYESGRVNMLILLPKQKGGFAHLVKHLNGTKLLGAIQAMESCRVNVKIPKMKFEQSFKLNEPLKTLGIKEAFGKKANFSRITGNEDLYISDVLHKAFVEVNEDGTEAAAATGVVMAMKCSLMIDRSEPKDFIADHPFLFAILSSNDKSVLFMGQFYASSH